MRSTHYLTTVAALLAPTFAQTYTSCNPLEKTCPADPALGKSVSYNFASGAPSDFTVAAGAPPTFTSDGAHFSIAQKGQAPTIASNWYMMFGHYKVVMKPAPGAGIVSSLVLLSDDLDEVDWEWVGSQSGKVQTNYFGKGNTATYDRGLTLSDDTSSFNTYEIDWTASHIQWIINGQVVRTLTPASADTNQYPQTPMQLKIGNWPAGDSDNSGTSQWAGGPVDWSKAPFDMIVKSVEATDYSTGKSYSYSNTNGTWESIVSNGGSVQGSGSVPSSVSTASASGTTIVASSTAIAISKQPVPTTTASLPTGQLGSGSVTATGSSTRTTLSTGATTASASSGSGSGSGSGTGSGSGSGSNNATVAVTPTGSSTTTSATGTTPSTGAGAAVKPLAGLAALGLLAVVAF